MIRRTRRSIMARSRSSLDSRNNWPLIRHREVEELRIHDFPLRPGVSDQRAHRVIDQTDVKPAVHGAVFVARGESSAVNVNDSPCRTDAVIPNISSSNGKTGRPTGETDIVPNGADSDGG